MFYFTFLLRKPPHGAGNDNQYDLEEHSTLPGAE